MSTDGSHFFNLPWPHGYYPASSDTSGYQYNPAGSIPQPSPKINTVPGQWVGEPVALLSLFTPGVLPVVRTYTWSSPLFDLRPEMRASGGRIPGNAVPVWRQLFGVGGKLWIQLGNFNADGFSKTELRVTATEFGHIVDTVRVDQIDDSVDVTTEIPPLAPSALLAFGPPGDGYPMRFWRLELTLEYLADNGADPNLVFQAAYY